MKKWQMVGSILIVVVVTAAAVVIGTSLWSPLPQESGDGGTCAQYGISVDATSISTLYEDTATVVEDPAAFWATDPGYQILSLSPWLRGQPLPPEAWAQDVERLASLPDEDRREAAAFTRAVEALEHADTFCSHAVPVIASLLPADAPLTTTVYLTALTDHSCCVTRGNVMMNTSIHNTTKFFNILGHELFHIGYFSVQPYQTEVWSDVYATKVFLTTLQNDGLAVYTQYLLGDDYPTPLEMEILLLRNPLALRFLRGRVNRLLRQSYEIPEEEILRKAFKGINQRALYVFGAHMARTIDEHLGREALAQTVAEGPRSFVATYNAIASRSLTVNEVPEAAELSPVQELRRAAIAGDTVLVADTVAAIRASGIARPDSTTFELLRSAGSILLRDGRPELAVEVFGLMAERFPEHPDCYLCLEEAYTQAGQAEQAQAAHRRAAEIDPIVVAVATR